MADKEKATVIDYSKRLHKIGCNGFSCVCCGKALKPSDLVLACTDCAAIFCEDCVNDGSFENHNCDDYEYEDEYEVE